ncbi:Imm9 family immunity protein [Citrobacter portucalensis]|uniref:Imm9 family immunity protein n=2 Tax=Citrobacter portucalensis TaxID=1639133 RepID=UPI002B23148F|nr:Imm9 family immunity protein [Citrobacter portucalensis]MEB0326067.1 Imm9 family immunity protein [Citrobacter portucalensis]MEB0358348.1 Imm9 family immunity protein [Citrobacter portucalensis]MEB0403659.1 Imm9 family immunity protein [Citrobacter portucalensis]UDR02456.1 immunity 9 family protein [Citrobacter freundii]
MSEKIRVLIGCEIPDLMNTTDLFSIGKELNSYIKQTLPLVNVYDLYDWSILISVNLRATNGIGVYKRIKRYPSDKEFEISISINIPDNKQINYGSSKVENGFYLPLDDNKFYIIHPNYDDYRCLRDYIYYSAKSAIILAFQNGFTCNGKKIKFQKNSND